MKRQTILVLAIIVVVTATSVSFADLSDGLVAYYPFSGNANDESGNGNHGVVLGDTALTLDMFGNANSAYSFDGSGDYIRASANNLPTADRTVSLWFYTDAVNASPYNPGYRPNLIGYGGGGIGRSWLMGINHWGHKSMGITCHYNVNTLEYFYGTDEPVGDWYHFAITTFATGTQIYIDGDMKASNSNFINNTYVNNKHLAIGVAVSTNGYAPYIDNNVGYFKGIMDNIRIYDRALSPSEIQEL